MSEDVIELLTLQPLVAASKGRLRFNDLKLSTSSASAVSIWLTWSYVMECPNLATRIVIVNFRPVKAKTTRIMARNRGQHGGKACALNALLLNSIWRLSIDFLKCL